MKIVRNELLNRNYFTKRYRNTALIHVGHNI